jgi:hypothetical protein
LIFARRFQPLLFYSSALHMRSAYALPLSPELFLRASGFGFFYKRRSYRRVVRFICLLTPNIFATLYFA